MQHELHVTYVSHLNNSNTHTRALKHAQHTHNEYASLCSRTHAVISDSYTQVTCTARATYIAHVSAPLTNASNCELLSSHLQVHMCLVISRTNKHLQVLDKLLWLGMVKTAAGLHEIMQHTSRWFTV